MSPSSTQQWTRRIRYSDQHIRVSDADRNAVAELLGRALRRRPARPGRVRRADQPDDGRQDPRRPGGPVRRPAGPRARGGGPGRSRRAERPGGPVPGAAGAAGSCARSCCCSLSSSARTSPGTPSPACSSFSRWSGPSSSSWPSCWSTGPAADATGEPGRERGAAKGSWIADHPSGGRRPKILFVYHEFWRVMSRDQ